jgi:flagellar motor switch protein FliN
MGDGALTQQEIDALLSGEADYSDFEVSGGKTEEEDGLADVAAETPAEPVKTKPKSKSTRADSGEETKNIALLMDVPMTLTVELGRTKKEIQEVLSFTDGYIVELDKLVGEPVDILVNDRIIGKGEVVIYDDDYCVRVVEIIDPQERLKYLQ